jgi:hypothetical protein
VKERRAFVLGVAALALFVVLYFAAAAVVVDRSGRVEQLADGRAVSIGDSWPGPFDRCVTDLEQPILPNCYREPVARDSSVKQLGSSGSALAYSLIGLLVLWGGVAGGVATIATAYRLWFGAVALAMGPGSILFHGTLAAWGGWFDQMSMYGLLSFIVAYNVVTLAGSVHALFVIVFVSALVLTGAAAAFTGDVSLSIFITCAVAVALLELAVSFLAPRLVRLRRSRTRLGIVFLILLAALIPWVASGPSAGTPLTLHITRSGT